MPDYQKSRAADADLKDIYHYTLRKWGREQARKYLARLKQCFRILAEDPTLGKARPEVREGYRSFVEGSHVIFYQALDNTVLIVRVLHGHQDVRRALGSEGEPEQ